MIFVDSVQCLANKAKLHCSLNQHGPLVAHCSNQIEWIDGLVGLYQANARLH